MQTNTKLIKKDINMFLFAEHEGAVLGQGRTFL